LNIRIMLASLQILIEAWELYDAAHKPARSACLVLFYGFYK